MDSDIKRKINTIGKVWRILTIIAKVIVIVGIVCLALIGTLSLVLPKDSVKISLSGAAQFEISEKLYKGKIPVISSIDGMDITLAGEDFETVSVEETDEGVRVNMASDGYTLDMRSVFRACLIGLIYLTAVLVMLCFLKSLMTEFKNCDTPFSDGVIRKMTNFAWSLVPMGVLSGFSGSDWALLLNKAGGRFHFSLNLSVVLVVLILFAIVQVFKYGAQLQLQSDETL
ncbi:MAG: hypothetical protein II882_09035 [Lachnospiraceae bacterium]|nr:hypothetical protein [Lachnospiraceae bacterium]